jgi:hypothetical protein
VAIEFLRHRRQAMAAAQELPDSVTEQVGD